MMNYFRYILLLISIPCLSQWTKVEIPSTASFRALKSRGRHIWVSGTQGTVGHSKDAGKTWTFQQIPHTEKLDFRDLAIINDKEIMLMSAGLSDEGKAVIFRTMDAGKKWNEIFKKNEPGYFFDCLHWDTANKRAWLLSDPIKQRLTLFSYKKIRFVELDASSTPELQTNEAFFAASGSSMLQAKGQLIFVGGGADSVKIYTYNISKNTWKTNNPGIASGEAKGYFSIGSKNKNEFWAVGGDYRKLNELSVPIITTIDGGKHWEIIQDTPKFYMEKVIWAKPYWIISGPSQSAAYHPQTKRWRSLGNSTYHNIIQVGDTIWGIGAKGQLGYISLSSITNLFLSKE
ncbi:YCF48-related protein [Aquirufa sp. LEOWEIH-7C]|uniref:YCF48-related protein n=1 Tax=Aquirufa regiilacus TaxID=3024868 RepID=A0ABU3TT84_9BACT|nr:MULTISPECIES: YCF48-related protein [unclassified Aquirufa]MDU0808872.1 YCF48-related protein [Aquirufa sp. LEOWEIH-7C]